jgi:ribosomal protein S18 acetylase RimI-like enzyme
MQIRSFRPDDLPTLKRILVAAFDGVSIDQGMEKLFGVINCHDWQWRKARHLDEDVARDPDGIFVAELDGRVLGFISTWMDHEAGIGHIPNLALEADCRGQGYGRKLIEFALQRFRDAGLTHAKIETLVQNAIGNHLYTSLGFREVARQIHFVAELRSGTQTGTQN